MAAVCGTLSSGAAAVFDLTSPTSTTHLRSLCAAVKLPHIQVGIDGSDPSFSNYFNYSINVFPHHAVLSRAVVDFIRSRQWTSVALLYTNDDGKFIIDEETVYFPY